MRMSSRPCLVAAALLAGLGLPAAAHAATTPTVSGAPGRVVIQVDDGRVLNTVDGSGAALGVALPDSATLLFGSGSGGRGVGYIAKLGPTGALDPTFGRGGVSTSALPGGSVFGLLQILRQADGKLLLVGANSLAGGFARSAISVIRLNADTTLDRTYGQGATATTPIGEGCGACTTAALQADGSLVLTGVTGSYPKSPTDASRLHWAVTRLTAAGAVDEGFGSGGLATVAPATTASGFNVAIGPGGTIVTEGQSDSGLVPTGTSSLLLARLLPNGTPDPTFNAGASVSVSLATGFLMHVGSDGSILIQGSPPRSASPQTLLSPAREYLVRYTALGIPDPTFGSGGLVDLGDAVDPSQLLAAAGGAVVVVGAPSYGLTPGSGPTPGRIIARLVAADGTIDTALTRTVDLPFGGGGSSFLVSVRPRPVAPLGQNSFLGKTLVRRSDGSYLVPGGVLVSQPTGEGTGSSIGRFAAAALTPTFALDTSFGDPAKALRLSVSLARQRACTAHTRHGIRITVKASAVGLARVKITHGGRAIALSLVPIFKTARHTLPIELTTYGNTYLRHHRNVKVTVTARARDLLTATATATAKGRLK